MVKKIKKSLAYNESSWESPIMLPIPSPGITIWRILLKPPEDWSLSLLIEFWLPPMPKVWRILRRCKPVWKIRNNVCYFCTCLKLIKYIHKDFFLKVLYTFWLELVCIKRKKILNAFT